MWGGFVARAVLLLTSTPHAMRALPHYVQAIEEKVAELGAENVLCVMSTTRCVGLHSLRVKGTLHRVDRFSTSFSFSCFAPRGMDDVESIATLCKRLDIGAALCTLCMPFPGAGC